MKKHWTEFLPEAGTISEKGKDQMYLNCRLEEAKKQVQILQAEYDDNEKVIHETALKAWTWNEIDEAKAKAIITQRTSEEIEQIKKQNEIHPIFQNVLKNIMP